MNYYMGLIVCHRAHPGMPPAAVVAAGIAAPQTKGFANDIGRIAAGIVPNDWVEQVSPSQGAAMMEASMCLFFAGAQYREPMQRAWTVHKLREICRLTGWHTADVIANGCESCWTKAAEAGRGPPYVRTRPVEGGVHKTGKRREYAANDKVIIVPDKNQRIHWALGLLGVDDDFKKLSLDDSKE